MKCYRTPGEFKKVVCRKRRLGQAEETCYWLTDRDGKVRVEKKAPKSYRGLKKAVFCVDDWFAVRKFGMWVALAGHDDEEWLMEEHLREAIDQLRKSDLYRPSIRAPRNVAPEIQKTLNGYLECARENLYNLINRQVIDEAEFMLEEHEVLTRPMPQGDLVNQAVA